MAITHGKDGLVKIGANTVGSVKSWTLNYDRGWYKTGYVGDDWKGQIEGQKMATGSVVVDTDLADTNGQVAMATAITGNTQVQLKLYFAGSTYWDFAADLDLVDASDVDSAIQRTFNFQSDGTVSYVTP